MNPADLSTIDRLTQRLYTLDIDGVVAVYRDAVSVHLPASKHEYNPNGKPGRAAASEIVKHARAFADTKETQIGLVIDIIIRCITDFDKAVKAGLKKQVLSSESHVWPFCNPEYPILETIARYWTNAIEILAKVDWKEAQATAAAVGREKFAKEAEAAREADKARETEQKAHGEPGIREREMIDQWAAKNQDEFAELDKQARAHVRFIFPKKINYPGKGVQQFDADAKINARKGWAYALYLVKLEEAIFQGKPIKSPLEIKAHGDSLRGYDTSGPKRRLARQSMVQAAAGVETNQTDKTPEAEKVAV